MIKSLTSHSTFLHYAIQSGLVDELSYFIRLKTLFGDSCYRGGYNYKALSVMSGVSVSTLRTYIKEFLKRGWCRRNDAGNIVFNPMQTLIKCEGVTAATGRSYKIKRGRFSRRAELDKTVFTFSDRQDEIFKYFGFPVAESKRVIAAPVLNERRRCLKRKRNLFRQGIVRFDATKDIKEQIYFNALVKGKLEPMAYMATPKFDRVHRPAAQKIILTTEAPGGRSNDSRSRMSRSAAKMKDSFQISLACIATLFNCSVASASRRMNALERVGRLSIQREFKLLAKADPLPVDKFGKLLSGYVKFNGRHFKVGVNKYNLL